MKLGLWGAGLAMALMATAFAAPVAQAAELRFGPQGDYGFGLDDEDGDAQFGVGGRVVADLSNHKRGVEGIASFDYFFPEEVPGADTTYWEINGNLAYNLHVKGSLRPYLGAGLNLAHASASVAGFSASDTDLGVNVLGGLKLNRNVYVEGRIELSGGKQLVFTAGYLF
jgi:opacity protein-like surface antigen